VVRFINHYIEKIRDSLDGKNIETVLTELGIRVHRVIYEHLQQFQFTIVGRNPDFNSSRTYSHDLKLKFFSFSTASKALVWARSMTII